MTTPTQDYQITWEKLPDDYKLPDNPVDNINQPALEVVLKVFCCNFRHF